MRGDTHLLYGSIHMHSIAIFDIIIQDFENMQYTAS